MASPGSIRARTSRCSRRRTFIAVVEQRQGLLVGSIEEVAYRMGYVDADGLRALAAPLAKSDYGRYLMELSAGAVPT